MVDLAEACRLSDAEVDDAVLSFMESAQRLITITDCGTVLSALAAAYTTYAPGSVVAMRSRELAQELEMTGFFLAGKYGV